MPAYGEQTYWEDRYSKDQESTYDWYMDYAELKDDIKEFLGEGKRILVVGCGNSTFSEDMYDDGFKTIESVDYSESVIKTMQQRNAETRPDLSFKVMDVRKMSTIADSSFDLVIDKGTLDAILCGENSTDNARQMLDEVHRVLSPNGVLLEITYGRPEVRLNHLDAPNRKWASEVRTVGGTRFMYVVKRGESAASAAANEPADEAKTATE